MAARSIDLPSGAIFRSDRGSNCPSAEFAAALELLDIRQSAGPDPGFASPIQLAESFNAALKVERVHRTAYTTRKMWSSPRQTATARPDREATMRLSCNSVPNCPLHPMQEVLLCRYI